MKTTRNAAFSTDEERWNALMHRDPGAEGAFFYGVATTAIYCLPACSSRLPKRANVRFFETAADAQRAGFRACKRCRPDSLPQTGKRHADAVVRACKLLDQADRPVALKDLAAAASLSPYYFHRLFKAMLGVTPKQYAASRRSGRLRAGLDRGGSVTQAIYDAGFGSSSRVYEQAAGLLGMTPSRFKNGAQGLAIRFAVAKAFLGSILVAATERGICAIDLGDNPEALIERLRERFPNAELRGHDSGFARWVAQVVTFIEVPRRGLRLPLDIQGTAFQQRVWKALQEIPAGSTATYAEVARRIASPRAVRAVARACASNAIAVAIPCHRVVGKDGNLSGYRWGVERKRVLLEREGSRPEAPQTLRPNSRDS